MPLYEYHCRDCDQPVELLVRGNAEELACPGCGGDGLTKLLSLPAAPAQATPASRGERLGEGPLGPCGSACGCFPSE